MPAFISLLPILCFAHSFWFACFHSRFQFSRNSTPSASSQEGAVCPYRCTQLQYLLILFSFHSPFVACVCFSWFAHLHTFMVQRCSQRSVSPFSRDFSPSSHAGAGLCSSSSFSLSHPASSSPVRLPWNSTAVHSFNRGRGRGGASKESCGRGRSRAAVTTRDVRPSSVVSSQTLLSSPFFAHAFVLPTSGTATGTASSLLDFSSAFTPSAAASSSFFDYTTASSSCFVAPASPSSSSSSLSSSAADRAPDEASVDELLNMIANLAASSASSYSSSASSSLPSSSASGGSVPLLPASPLGLSALQLQLLVVQKMSGIVMGEISVGMFEVFLQALSHGEDDGGAKSVWSRC